MCEQCLLVELLFTLEAVLNCLYQFKITPVYDVPIT